MKKLTTSILSLLTIGVATVSAQLVEYNFNDPTYTFTGATQPGSGSVSTGSDTTAVGFQNAFGGFPRGDGQTNGFSGSSNFFVQNGVSGESADYSFRPDTDTMGGSSTPGAAQSMARTTGAVSALNSLQSFTISGWLQTADSTQLGNFARVLDNYDGTNGFRLRNNGTNGVLELTVQTSSFSSNAVYTGTESWFFFAVTYDAITDDAAFYIGDLDNAVSLVNSGTIALAGSNTGINTDDLAIGNTRGGGRPFNGFLDDIAIYGTTSGGSGALTLSEIEAVRAAAIPEPTSAALVLGAMTLLAFRRRRS